MTDQIEIIKGSPQFIRAYEKPEQIHKWWEHNPHAIGIAFVGRSNVGKSSLINAMFGNKTARTSKTPGRTQKINVFTFKLTKQDEEYNFYLYDLPGYGHAKVSKQMSKNWMLLMDAFFTKLNPHTLLLNIQDARHPDQKTDQSFQEYVNTTLLDIYLVFNKIDKLKKQKERAALDKLKPGLFAKYKRMKEIFFVSAEKRTELDPLEQAVVSYFLKNKLELDKLVETSLS